MKDINEILARSKLRDRFLQGKLRSKDIDEFLEKYEEFQIPSDISRYFSISNSQLNTFLGQTFSRSEKPAVRKLRELVKLFIAGYQARCGSIIDQKAIESKSLKEVSEYYAKICPEISQSLVLDPNWDRSEDVDDGVLRVEIVNAENEQEQ